jgi:hypothetical protein
MSSHTPFVLLDCCRCCCCCCRGRAVVAVVLAAGGAGCSCRSISAFRCGTPGPSPLPTVPGVAHGSLLSMSSIAANTGEFSHGGVTRCELAEAPRVGACGKGTCMLSRDGLNSRGGRSTDATGVAGVKSFDVHGCRVAAAACIALTAVAEKAPLPLLRLERFGAVGMGIAVGPAAAAPAPCPLPPPADEAREEVDDAAAAGGGTASGHMTVTEERLFCRREGVIAAAAATMGLGTPAKLADVTQLAGRT